MSQKNLSLQVWVEKTGAQRVADLVGVSRSAVNYWRSGYVLPSTRQFGTILKLTKGKLDITQSYKTYFSAQNKNRHIK